MLLALVARLILAPLYTAPPGESYSIQPHDYPKYMATAATILEGRILYEDITHNDSPTPYGPLLALSWAGWIKVFGKDYTLFKIPSIIYDVLTVVLIFFITKSLFNQSVARYTMLFYAFSFIPLLMSGADGSDENPLMFFLLLSVYLLVKSNPQIKLSAFFLGIALLFKLVLGIVFIPLIVYYLLQKRTIRQAFTYLGITLLIISLVTFPFFLKAGANVFIQLSFGAVSNVNGTTLLSAIKMIVNYFTLGMASTYDYNPVVQIFAYPVVILSVLGGVLYVVKFGLKDKRIELVRNIFIFILLFTVFGNFGNTHIFIWLIPYIIILLAYKQHKLNTFKLSKLEIFGFVLLFVSTILYATLYKETKIPEYSLLEQFLLLLSVGFATLGTYFSLNKIKLRIAWTLSTFSWAWWLTNHAKLLMLIGQIIPIFRNPLWAYGVQDFSSVVLITISSLYILFSLHKIETKYVSENLIELLRIIYREIFSVILMVRSKF